MTHLFWTTILILLTGAASASPTNSLKEINLPNADTNHLLAIVDATLIDRQSSSPVADAVMVVRGDKIDAEPGRVEDDVGQRIHLDLAAVAAAGADLAQAQRATQQAA